MLVQSEEKKFGVAAPHCAS